MSAARAAGVLGDVAPGTHVCWVVDDPAVYLQGAAVLLRRAQATREKPVVFGPDGAVRDELAPLAAMALDPLEAVLGGGPLDPAAMAEMFRQQSAIAADEGYRRLRVVADMDWLLPTGAGTADIVGLELRIEEEAHHLDATLVCAYRTESFDTDAIGGAMCVHPADAGPAPAPQFRMVATGDGAHRWKLAGELDLAVTEPFSTAIRAATAQGARCVIDVSGLEFIDVASMRAIAVAARDQQAPVELVGARPVLSRGWQLAGFAALAPSVALVG